jgi:hypothetical protein
MDAVTVRVAVFEKTVPAGLVTATEYNVPFCESWALDMTSVELVAPKIGTPPRYHWYVNGPTPAVMAMLNVTLPPTVVDSFAGPVKAGLINRSRLNIFIALNIFLSSENK